MKRLAAVLVAIGLWFAPLRLGSDGAVSLRSDEGCYRMRLCELALFSGESATHDQLLEWGEGQDVPYGAFAPAASAFVLARLLPRDTLDLEHGEIDEDALAYGAQRWMLVLAWIAALSIAFASSKFAAREASSSRASPWTFAGTLVSALAFMALALAPSFDGGSVRSTVWGLMLCSLVLGGAALLARPRELADQVGLAIGFGLLAGLALVNDLFTWPAVLAPLISLALCARGEPPEQRRNALRAAIFFVATALIVSALRTPWPAGVAPWPLFESAWSAHRLSAAELLIDVLCIALVAWLVLGGPASAQRRTLSLVLVSSFVLRAIDARFAAAPLAPAGCALAWWATSMGLDSERGFLRRALSLGVVAVMLLAVALNGNAQRALAGSDSIRALRELRHATPASGAWNHPRARQEYAILANPRAAGTIVFHTRRPVCGALLPGAPVRAAAREAAGAMLAESTEALAARAKALYASYVIVARRDLEQTSDLIALSGGSFAENDSASTRALALRQLLVQNAVSGFQLVSRVPPHDALDGIAELAVWRLVSSMPEREPASMSAR